MKATGDFFKLMDWDGTQPAGIKGGIAKRTAAGFSIPAPPEADEIDEVEAEEAAEAELIAFLDERFQRCGLNADWCCDAWHMGAGEANVTDGELYAVDTEDGAFAVTRRWFGDDDRSVDLVWAEPAEVLAWLCREGF